MPDYVVHAARHGRAGPVLHWREFVNDNRRDTLLLAAFGADSALAGGAILLLSRA